MSKKKQYTHILMLLDRSGSMSSCINGTISGYNEFLNEQRKGDDLCKLTLIQFDSAYEPNYENQPIESAPALTPFNYQPRGSTALVGAMGKAIDELGDYLAGLPENKRPERVVFVTITDGLENMTPNTEWGKKYTEEKVKSMVEHQRDKYKWQFVYLGANQDAFLVAKQYGFTRDATMHYASTDTGSPQAFKGLALANNQYRSSGTVGASANYFAAVKQDIAADDPGLVNKLSSTTTTSGKKN